MKKYFMSDGKYLKLDINFPYKEMLEEAKRLKDRFVLHRNDESKGWKSLTLHGHGEQKTGTWKEYGYKDSIEASKDLFWTDAAKECPITYNYFLNYFPSKKYGRIRFMLLEAGGYIGMHTDSKSGIKLIENITMVLNNPEGCVWKWGDWDNDLIMQEGVTYAMNVSYYHSVINNSDQDRYHIIVTRHDSLPEWKALMNKSAEIHGIVGQYIDIKELP